MTQKLTAIFGLMGLLLFFQNCQKSEYGSVSADSTSSKASALTSVETDDTSDSEGTEPAVEHGTPTDDSSGRYVCILAGPGKSIKLALNSSGALEGQHPVPSVVCISANACNHLVSKVFQVKGPEFRGYCKDNGNPHVTSLTDEQISSLLSKM